MNRPPPHILKAIEIQLRHYIPGVTGDEVLAALKDFRGKAQPTPASGEEVLLVTVAEAARRLSVSKRTIWRLINKGALTPIRLPTGAVRISVEQLRQLRSA